jgi:hypothetical protein
MTKREKRVSFLSMPPLMYCRHFLEEAQKYQWIYRQRVLDDYWGAEEKKEAAELELEAYRDIAVYCANIERLAAAGHIDAPPGPLGEKQRVDDWDAFEACRKRVEAEFPPNVSGRVLPRRFYD